MRKFVYHLFVFLTVASAFMTFWMLCATINGNILFAIPTILFGILAKAIYWFVDGN